MPVGLFDFRARAGDGGSGAVEGGLGIKHGVRRLLRLLGVVGLLRGAQLFLCPAQRVLILRQRLLLDPQLVVEQGHPGGEAGNAGIDVLDARRGQFEAALRNGDLLSETGNGGVARFYGTPGRVPAGLRQAQRLVAGGDLRGGLFDGGTGAVQLCLGGGKSVGGVLRGLFQRHLLAFQLLDLCRLLAVFFLDQVEITPGRDGGGVRLAQRVAVLAVGARRAGDFLFELCLPVLCLFKPPGVFTLPGVAFLQLIAGLPKCALILPDRILLQRQRALERVELGGKAGRGLFKVLHACAGQLEEGLRLLDLFLNRADVAGKVVAVQRKRYDQIAERFAQIVLTCLGASESGFHIGPDLVDVAGPGLCALPFVVGLPRPDAEEAGHVHAVDLIHAPSALEQGIVGGIDEFRQRQAGFFSACVAAGVVGKSLRMPVVCVCTARSASATSCMSRSTG